MTTKKLKIEEKFKEEIKEILTEKQQAIEYTSKDPLENFLKIWENEIYEISRKINKSTDLKRYGDIVTQYGNFRIKFDERLQKRDNNDLENYEFEDLKENNDASTTSNE